MSSRRRLTPYWLLGPGIIWLILFFLLPMYFMGEMALRSGSFTEGFVFTWEFSNFSSAISENSEQLIRSIQYGVMATVIALLIAYPLAYAIAMRAGRWKTLMLLAVVAPFFTTYLIRTIAWKTILADASPAVSVMQFLHLVPEDGKVLATSTAVVAGLTYNLLPFMILPIYASIERLDTRLIEAAKDLYSSSLQTFLRVTLPLTMPGIVAGVLLTFIPSVGDYINAELLGSPSTSMIGNVIQAEYLKNQNYPEAAALSFVMMAAILVIVLIYLRTAGTGAFMEADDDEDDS
ncbi:MAG: ABC transporter permease [Solirubrobacterales bacterium]